MSTTEHHAALPESVRAVRTVIERLFVLVRTLAMHDEAHPLALQNAATLAQGIDALGPPFALQFVGQALFVDRALVTLDLASFDRARRLAVAFARMHVNEVYVELTPDPLALAQLAGYLARGATAAPSMPGILLREIRGVRSGVEGESVEPELFAATQIVRALTDVERIVNEPASEPWPWSQGMGVVRRLERAIDAGLPASEEVIELAPGERGVARKALHASFHALAMLRVVGAHITSQRAAAHAALAISCEGLRARGGDGFSDAAGSARRRLVATAAPPSTGVTKSRIAIDPHRLRVSAIAHAAVEAPARATRERAPPPAITGAVALAYEVERRRCPEGRAFDLTLGDVLGEILAQRVEPRWARVLVAVHGSIPPGARVRLQDGSVGVVLGGGSGDDPRRPRVYTDGAMVVPDGPVDIVTETA